MSDYKIDDQEVLRLAELGKQRLAKRHNRHRRFVSTMPSITRDATDFEKLRQAIEAYAKVEAEKQKRFPNSRTQ